MSGHKIKVVCRVRPFLKTEKPDDSVAVEGKTVLRVTNPRDTTKDVKFNFDACYSAKTRQDTIYKNDVRPLVETIFNGMSATVFCYGVTGAGKTHTIQGTEGQPGIIPRALEHIFMHQKHDAFDYDIRISYFEIYKEAVFDLLRPREASGTSGLPIREDANHRVFVAGLSQKKVTSLDQFHTLYQRACGNRRTASTKLNHHSSRSHAILTVQVQWPDDLTKGKVWCGRLHLIDLAGSEDNRRTENGRDRMAESSAINRSLFVLGQVVEALNSGASRIPYRDSKMTRILQDALGGESLGMMIVNVSPGAAFLQDTHNTLSFATKSREVVNKPPQPESVEARWAVSERTLQNGRALSGRPLSAASAQTASLAGPANGASKRRRAESEEIGRASVEVPPRPRSQPSSVDTKTKKTLGTSNGSNNSGSNNNNTAANDEIMQRVMRIEKQLSTSQLDSNVVIDLFTPATKLKTSRGWLKHARELESKGDLEKALVHYEEAQKYAPELNRLEAHISKLRARIRRQKRRSSIASHGEAGVVVRDKDADGVGENGDVVDEQVDGLAPAWVGGSIIESPAAEKANRIALGQLRGSVAPSMVGARPKPYVFTSKPQPLFADPDIVRKADGTSSTSGATKNGTSINGATGVNGANAAKRVKLLGDGGGRRTAALTGVAISQRKFTSITEGSVHDRRISFGTASLNPFVVGGDEFQSDLQARLEENRKIPLATLRANKLDAKSTAAARLRRALQEPMTPDDRKDKDFVLASDASDEDDFVSAKAVPGKGRRTGRVPGSLSVRGLVERRMAAEQTSGDEMPANGRAERLSDVSTSSRTKASPVAEEKLSLAQFNEICLASAVQMINSADVKKIIKLQGIGKRRAEQIQASILGDGPIDHISELQSRLKFKNKLILDILSTFA
ncbi:hypothetical protein GGI07_005205 [Coemansia sp. Benny D115]|nr:hypothetical protein GGI07_005205 [Coemansia sp. Benny D115]